MSPSIKTKVLSIVMLFLLPASISIQGCYYDDGPFLSFRSTKGRIANTWVFNYAENQGTDVTDDFSDALLQLSKDGGLVFDMGNGTIETGEWILSFDRKLLTLSYGTDPDITEDIFLILRLKESEMWLQQESGDQKRWELVPD